MTLATTVAALSGMTVTGVTTARTAPPQTVNTGELPLSFPRIPEIKDGVAAFSGDNGLPATGKNTMTYKTRTVSLDKHIDTVRLNRPEKANAMNADMWQEIRRAFRWVDETADARVAISYGALASSVAGSGRPPRRRSMDLLIAATAHAFSARLYTRNADDFVGLGDLVDVVVI